MVLRYAESEVEGPVCLLVILESHYLQVGEQNYVTSGEISEVLWHS